MHLRMFTSITLAAVTAAAASLVACSSDDTAVTPVATDAGAGTDSSMTTPVADGGAPGTDGSTTVELGPGAALKCASSGKDAWDTYGGPAFVAVNKSIVAKATTPASLAAMPQFTKIGSGNPPSTGDSATIFEAKLAAFLVYAYGGPASLAYGDAGTFAGPQDMKAAHAGQAITKEQYAFFITNVVVPALTDNMVPAGGPAPDGGTLPDDVGTCFAPLITGADGSPGAAFAATIIGQ